MEQEGSDVFDTEDSREETEILFKWFVVYPVEERLPFCLYKLKIPPSPIAKYWPLGAVKSKDVPIIDFKEVKSFYDSAKKELNQNQLKFNEISEKFLEFNKKKNANQARGNAGKRNHPRVYVPPHFWYGNQHNQAKRFNHNSNKLPDFEIVNFIPPFSHFGHFES